MFALFIVFQSAAKTIVLPIFAGVVHTPCPAAATILEPKLSTLGLFSVQGLLVVFPHEVRGGIAKTTQFPHRSLKGFGIAPPTV